MHEKAGFDVWWHGIAALPAGPEDQAYSAMRRVWADHTINANNGPRSFYRWGTEDYVTLALWQTWSIFDDLSPIAGFLRTTGADVGSLIRVRWAYACEEIPDFGPKIIPDIMLQYEDERGSGLVALEVKKPGTAASNPDSAKLQEYCRLPSARTIARRHGCFLVSESAAAGTCRNTDSRHPLVTWERLADAQASGVERLGLAKDSAALVEAWIRRHFANAGIGVGAGAPEPRGATFGSADSFEAIRKMALPEKVERFLMGSECVEAVHQGQTPSLPLDWLAREPTLEDVRRSKWQSTTNRRVCRWSFDWSQRREPSCKALWRSSI